MAADYEWFRAENCESSPSADVFQPAHNPPSQPPVAEWKRAWSDHKIGASGEAIRPFFAIRCQLFSFSSYARVMFGVSRGAEYSVSAGSGAGTDNGTKTTDAPGADGEDGRNYCIDI